MKHFISAILKPGGSFRRNKTRPEEDDIDLKKELRNVQMTMLTVIGRGHSGTRAMSHTLSRSGVYMGSELNISGDMLPPDDMYEACRIMAKYVKYEGNLRWDFSMLHTMPIDPEFVRLTESYLSDVVKCNAVHKGWKLPETALVYPWIVRIFPDIKYIHLVRNPRDCIIGAHLTDDLADFGIPYDRTDDERLRRAISWKYQRDIFKATPQPAHSIVVRFEDFVLRQEETLARLEQFLGFHLERIPVRKDSIGRWKTDKVQNHFSFFEPEMLELGYLSCDGDDNDKKSK
ncbi:MAG: sulfotransferase [Clostridiales bacterium]|nr:sulfotransferase [Clostridiales bacterium]